MSRIGKKPIEIPSGVKVEQQGKTIKVSGSLGNMEMECHRLITVKIDTAANVINVENPQPDLKEAKKLHGTMRVLIDNMVTGVSKGFEKSMMIFGTGYNLKDQGGKLVLNIGFSHPVEMPIPKGLKVVIDVPATRGNDVPAKFKVTGFDKQLMGQFAANIRRVKPPEPYQGKGIRYADEHVRRKEGKAFASGGA